MSSSTRTATTMRKMNLRLEGRAGGAIVVATMETSIVTKNRVGMIQELSFERLFLARGIFFFLPPPKAAPSLRS